MNQQELMSSERERALKLFSAKHKTGFENKVNFADWFVEQLSVQKSSCYYCETSILEIRHLIELGLLKTRKTGYGLRGTVLEVDRRINHLVDTRLQIAS